VEFGDSEVVGWYPVEWLRRDDGGVKRFAGLVKIRLNIETGVKGT
jgi:hypothetical protein